MFLYHNNWLDDECSAIKMLEAVLTGEPLEPVSCHFYNGDLLPCLSLTRNRGMAFENRTYGLVVFELILDKLKHHNVVMPFDGHLSYNYQGECDRYQCAVPDQWCSFDSYQFQHTPNVHRSRLHSASQGFVDLAEELVIGPIPRFERCIERIYLLHPDINYYPHDPENVDILTELCFRLNIPLTIESTPRDISTTDIVKSYQYQRKSA
jgi:hypothetical protein